MGAGQPFGLDDPNQAARVPQGMREHYRRLYGLDQPLPGSICPGWATCCGAIWACPTAIATKACRPCWRAWPVSAWPGLVTLAIALALGVPLGALAATQRGRPLDHLSRGLALFALGDSLRDAIDPRAPINPTVSSSA